MIHYQPLSFYVEKLERGEPFSSLLYGDGEFLVAARKRTCQTMQNGEVVTKELEDEMRRSLALGDHLPENGWGHQEPCTCPPIYRGTDPSIADPSSYGGRDIDAVQRMHRAMVEVAGERDWYDGTVWDSAVREGKLGPLIRAFIKRDVVIVGNVAVQRALFGMIQARPGLLCNGISIPTSNAYTEVNALEKEVPRGEGIVYIVCMGLGAIPLIMRLRRHNPQGTYLDLGSTFDVFAGIGAERGWRAELYQNPEVHRELIRKNLEGI